jgi:hypothetical protein
VSRPGPRVVLCLILFGLVVPAGAVGDSDDIANLFPEQLYVRPGYRIKDKLENKLHALVCAGSMTLRSVRVRISTDWQALYERVYGVSPSG